MSNSIGGKVVGNFTDAAIADDTDFFASNIAHPADGRDAVTFTIRARFSADTILTATIDSTSSLPDTKSDVEYFFNKGTALLASGVYIFDLIIVPGESFNLQLEADAGATVDCLVVRNDFYGTINAPQG